MTDLHKSKPFLWGLFLLFCVVWLYALGARTLVPSDEGRYAEMAREMVATGDWITTRLNGIKYFEKPPLQIWMNALTFELFGLGEWQARLWTGLCGLLGVLLTAHTGRRVFNERVGLYAALVLGSSFLWAVLGHINTLDMGLSGMMTLALCGLLLGQRDNAGASERRNWMLLCWAGMALAVMSKGLIGVVLPGAVLVLYTLVSRDWAIWKRLHLGWGLAFFFAITTPWFVLASIKNPEFPHFFFIHEHWERFFTKVHHREGPWHYFIKILILGILPWLGLLAQSLWQARDHHAQRFQPKKMLLVWTLFIFFFFSISSSKLPSYILPIFPALALLIGAYLERVTRFAWMLNATLMALIGIGGLATAAYMPHIATRMADPLEVPNYLASQPWMVAAFSVILAGAVLALWRTPKTDGQDGNTRTMSVAILAMTAFIGGQLLTFGTEAEGRYRAGLQLVPAIEAELTPAVKLYAVGLYDQTLPFYLRRTMTLVEHPDELEFGLSIETHLWLKTRAEFIAQWRKGTKSLAITRPEIFTDLQRQGVPMRVVARDARRVVIANDPK